MEGGAHSLMMERKASSHLDGKRNIFLNRWKEEQVLTLVERGT